MGTPRSGQTERKFTNDQLLEVFEGPYRKQIGKIELSAKEVAEILSEHILDGDETVTRQAVDKRFSDLIGDGPGKSEPIGDNHVRLVRAKHGRPFLYSREVDHDAVFQIRAHAGIIGLSDFMRRLRVYGVSRVVGEPPERTAKWDNLPGPSIRKRDVALYIALSVVSGIIGSIIHLGNVEIMLTGLITGLTILTALTFYVIFTGLGRKQSRGGSAT